MERLTPNIWTAIWICCWDVKHAKKKIKSKHHLLFSVDCEYKHISLFHEIRREKIRECRHVAQYLFPMNETRCNIRFCVESSFQAWATAYERKFNANGRKMQFHWRIPFIRDVLKTSNKKTFNMNRLLLVDIVVVVRYVHSFITYSNIVVDLFICCSMLRCIACCSCFVLCIMKFASMATVSTLLKIQNLYLYANNKQWRCTRDFT